jgi:hypothetical protein
MTRHKTLSSEYCSRKENNMRNKLQDDERRLPKFRKAELQDRASLAECCYKTSYLSLLAGLGGVVIHTIILLANFNYKRDIVFKS